MNAIVVLQLSSLQIVVASTLLYYHGHTDSCAGLSNFCEYTFDPPLTSALFASSYHKAYGPLMQRRKVTNELPVFSVGLANVICRTRCNNR